MTEHTIDRRLSIAPMLDWTDRHFRYLARLISRHTLLYTEMITTGALLYNEPARFLDFDASEHPIALQLGGSDPDALARCCALAGEWGYDEVNLNLGCPSDRVQSGRFGACLMAEPALVADCIRAMSEACPLPITAKHRIGIDERDSYTELVDFVGTLAEAGCETFIIHSRKAWLQGLSPKENRDIPPLCYDTTYRIKRDFPQLEIIVNGGILSLDEAEQHLQQVDGVMIGRAAYHDSWLLAEADRRIFGDDHPLPERHAVVEQMLPYVERQMRRGVPLGRITRHMLSLFQGQPGAKRWRRHISENAHKPGMGPELIREALSKVPRHA